MNSPANPQPSPSAGRRILVFLGCLILLIFVADRGVGALLRHLQSRDRAGMRAGGRLQRVLSGQVHPLLLVLGNSRATHGVDPSQFPYPTFNLGHDGRHLYFITGVVGLLQEQGRLPPALLLHISREDLVTDSAGSFALADRRFLRTFRRPGNWVDRAAASWPFTDRLKFISDLYPFNGQLPYLLQDFYDMRTGREPLDGFEPLPREPDDSANTVTLYQRSLAPSQIPIRVSQGQVEMLADLITRLRGQHVFLALYTSPEYRDDTSYYAPVYRALDSLIHAQDVPYLDFNRGHLWPLDEIGFFKDDGHLNQDGAERLSQALRQWLRPYLVSYHLAPSDPIPSNEMPSNGNSPP